MDGNSLGRDIARMFGCLGLILLFFMGVSLTFFILWLIK